MIGKITRMDIDGSYVWGIYSNNEFVECSRLLSLIEFVDGVKATAGAEIEIKIENT